MGIGDDLKEMGNAFSRASALGKLLIVISMFLTISSLASLSENLIKWKGFILDAINLYQQLLVEPIRSFGNKIGMEFTTMELHTAILCSIALSTGMRVLAIGQIIAYEEINKTYNGNAVPNLTMFWVVPIIFIPAMFIWFGYSTKPPNLWLSFIIFLIFPIFITAPKVLLSRLFPDRFANYKKDRFSYVISYYLLVAGIFLCVGILGAFNSVFFK